MKVFRNEARKGFSLVELLAVVMILAVLAAIAVPLYINSRRVAAARTCMGNLALIAAAEAAWSLRNGSYITTFNTQYVAPVGTASATGGLVGAPEGLSTAVFCPLDGTTAYTGTPTGAAPNQGLRIECPHADLHVVALSGYPAVGVGRTMAAAAPGNHSLVAGYRVEHAGALQDRRITT